jgi:hypothetical protein
MKNVTKKCNKCGVEKGVDEFSKDSSNNCYKRCKVCKDYDKKYKLENKDKIRKYNLDSRNKNQERDKKYREQYRLKNKDRILSRIKKYRLENKDKVKEQSKKYNKTYYRKNKDRERSRLRKYNAENKIKIRQYKIKRYYSDPAYRILQCLRPRVKDVLKGVLKSQSTIELLGCTALDLKNYLSKHFLPGMSWENYGKGIGKWNIDHIIPCNIFYFIDPSEQKQCFHYTNLRPLWERGPGGNFEKQDKTQGLNLLYNDLTPFLR